MKIYYDVFSGDELCSDGFKITHDGALMLVSGKDVKRTTENNFDIGANASQEEQAEDFETETVAMGIDVCMNHDLEDCTGYYTDIKEYTKYLKTYMKRLGKWMKENGQDTEENKTALLESYKKLNKLVVEKEDDFQFFKAPFKETEGDIEDSFHIPLQRDGNNITLYYFTLGLKEVKV